MSMSEKAASLRRLFDRLTCFKVEFWGPDSQAPDLRDRFAEADVRKADVVSSRYNNRQARHAVVLDIDHPAWLVESSTPGHFHLYIDVPGGIPHGDYMRLLQSLATCGIIEPGYASASQSRGHSDVRLPWVKKPKPQPPVPRSVPDPFDPSDILSF